MRLLFLSFFFTIITYSQSVKVAPFTSIKAVSIDSLNNNIFVFYEAALERINLSTFKKEFVKIEVPNNFKISSNELILVDGVIYFLSISGGMVYKLDKNKIERIDNSFDHKMQINAAVFAHDSKLFKYGGYGFWSARDFFTYYDTKINEWELYGQPTAKSEKPSGTFNNIFMKNGNDIYFFNGFQINEDDRFKKFKDRLLWKYNFLTNEWTKLGETSSFSPGYLIKNNHKLINIKNSSIEEIDFIKNTVSVYNKTVLNHKIFIGLPSFFMKNSFYYFVYQNGEVSLKTIAVKDFYGKLIRKTKFYKNYYWWWKMLFTYFFTPLILTFIAFKLYKIIQKRKKIILLNNGLKYKNTFTEFDDTCLKIVELLLNNEQVESTKILNIVEKNQYSSAHNERIKVQKIEQINVKIGALLGSNNSAIISTKSTVDRRIRLYSFSKEVKRYI